MRRAAKVAGAAAALILPASSYVAYKYRLHHSSYYARHPNGFVRGMRRMCAMQRRVRMVRNS